jgi:hypothetical protein
MDEGRRGRLLHIDPNGKDAEALSAKGKSQNID